MVTISKRIKHIRKTYISVKIRVQKKSPATGQYSTLGLHVGICYYHLPGLGPILNSSWPPLTISSKGIKGFFTFFPFNLIP